MYLGHFSFERLERRRRSSEAAIAVAGDLHDGGVMGEAVDEPDGAGRVGEDGVPVAEGDVRGEDDRLLLVAARDDLEEQVRGVGIVGQVADLIDAQELRPGVVTETLVEGAGGLLAIEASTRSAAVVKSAEWPCRIAWCTVFLAIMVLPSPWAPTRTRLSV